MHCRCSAASYFTKPTRRRPLPGSVITTPTTNTTVKLRECVFVVSTTKASVTAAAAKTTTTAKTPTTAKTFSCLLPFRRPLLTRSGSNSINSPASAAPLHCRGCGNHPTTTITATAAFATIPCLSRSPLPPPLVGVIGTSNIGARDSVASTYRVARLSSRPNRSESEGGHSNVIAILPSSIMPKRVRSTEASTSPAMAAGPATVPMTTRRKMALRSQPATTETAANDPSTAICGSRDRSGRNGRGNQAALTASDSKRMKRSHFTEAGNHNGSNSRKLANTGKIGGLDVAPTSAAALAGVALSLSPSPSPSPSSDSSYAVSSSSSVLPSNLAVSMSAHAEKQAQEEGGEKQKKKRGEAAIVVSDGRSGGNGRRSSSVSAACATAIPGTSAPPTPAFTPSGLSASRKLRPRPQHPADRLGCPASTPSRVVMVVPEAAENGGHESNSISGRRGYREGRRGQGMVSLDDGLAVSHNAIGMNHAGDYDDNDDDTAAVAAATDHNHNPNSNPNNIDNKHNIGSRTNAERGKERKPRNVKVTATTTTTSRSRLSSGVSTGYHNHSEDSGSGNEIINKKDDDSNYGDEDYKVEKGNASNDDDKDSMDVESAAALTRPPPVNSDYLPLPWKGRLGYACLNTYLRTATPSVFSSRTCRIASILEHRHPLRDPSQPEHATKNRPDREQPAEVARGQAYVEAIGLANARDIIKMVRWNERYGIRFMRLSSEMFPFASHKEYGYQLAPFAAQVLTDAGKVIAELGHRVSTHPGQFTQLGSPRSEVIEASIRDLEYHDEMLGLLQLPAQQNRDAIMILHMGGTFGDKAATLARFETNYARLSPSIKQRLVLENDDVSWSVHDLLPVCERLNIPLVLDYHHHNIIFDADHVREGTLDIMSLYDRITATWRRKGIRQKMHYSEPTEGAVTPSQRRKHSPRVATLPPCPDDMDLMIEAKDKEQAVFELMRTFKLPGHERFTEMTPHVREDENKPLSSRVKNNNKKKKTNSKDDDNDDDDGSIAQETIPDDEVGMGGPKGRVYWPLGREDWLRPVKRVVKKKEKKELSDVDTEGVKIEESSKSKTRKKPKKGGEDEKKEKKGLVVKSTRKRQRQVENQTEATSPAKAPAKRKK